MKKNKMLRIASVMLVLALITTCIISGTFAKYVTSDSGFDSARVAKWGVKIRATSDTAFGSVYKINDGTINTTYTAGTDSVKGVKTENGEEVADRVVAPGTNGTVAAVRLSGKPEVKCTVTYAATIVLTGWELPVAQTTEGGDTPATEEYCPIVFTIGTETYGTSVTSATKKYDTVAALITAVQNAIAASSHTYEAGTDLRDSTVIVPSISWKWEFETGDDAEAKAANNVKDTALGDAADDGNAATISISLVITVAQED